MAWQVFTFPQTVARAAVQTSACDTNMCRPLNLRVIIDHELAVHLNLVPGGVTESRLAGQSRWNQLVCSLHCRSLVDARHWHTESLAQILKRLRRSAPIQNKYRMFRIHKTATPEPKPRLHRSSRESKTRTCKQLDR